MKKEQAHHAGTADEPRRKHRPRPVPRWLTQSAELDAIARSRCLMVLSVLSGEKPVTDAIREAKISRGTYYQMETRALNAMLAVLNPLASASDSGSADLSAAACRIAGLEARVQRLEQEKRRAERLLLLTRKSIRAPVTTGHRGRWPSGLRSIPTGSAALPLSKTKGAPSGPSTRTTAGGNAP